MSTTGKYGERQSWRRTGNAEAGKRRTLKVILTLVAVVLIAVFAYMILGPKEDRRLVTVLVSNEYDTSVITPPMYAENAHAQLAAQLGAIEFNKETAAVVRSSFEELGSIDQDSDGQPDLDLDDPDDTMMVIVRGYLMVDQSGEPSIACSDLAIGRSPEQPSGLLPIADVLRPLVKSMPEGFDGTRLVVLDVDPLAAQPTLGQWNDRALEQLEQTIQDLEGPADRLWVLVTRGPMQNVGWNHATELPCATEILLDALGGRADLDPDYKIELRELVAYINHVYENLPDKPSTSPPRLMLLRGGQGLVESDDFARGDLDVWIARSSPTPAEPEPGDQPEPDPSDPSQSDPAQSDSAQSASAQSAHAGDQPAAAPAATAPRSRGAAGQVATNRLRSSTAGLPVRSVAYQPPSGPASAADAGQTGEAGTNAKGDVSGAALTPAPSGDPQPSAPAAAGVATHSTDSTGDTDASAANASEPSFWDRRDQFESVPLGLSGQDTGISAIALAPHRWRQLIVKVLGAEIRDFDSQSPNATADQAKSDLESLLQRVKGQPVDGNLNDFFVQALDMAIVKQRLERASKRSDQRLQAADALQHAIAAARTRIWSHLEFQRQAILVNAQIPVHNLLEPTVAAEQVLASGRGPVDPPQGMLDREIDKLHKAIGLFDRNVAGGVDQLIRRFAGASSRQSWELSRMAWAWLRSPLPTGPQRRQLREAIAGLELDFSIAEDDPTNTERIVFAPAKADRASLRSTDDYRKRLIEYERVTSDPTGVDLHDRWRQWLTAPPGPDPSFADRFAAALRIDPRIDIGPVEAFPLSHLIEAKPKIRRPSARLVNSEGQALDEGAMVRLETMQDVRRIELELNPDREQATRLLVTYQLRSAANQLGNPPVDVAWKVPGAGDLGAGDPLPISIEAESKRNLALEIRALDLAEPGEACFLELQVRADRVSDEVQGVVGTYRLPIELPRENRLRVVASSYQGVGCSKEVVSGDDALPGGLWLRTFNSRKTPFKLELFNESDKACLAEVWLIKLPNPMPEVAAYWPEFAANRYSNPAGRMLDAEGRIRSEFLRNDRVLKGPKRMPIPAGKQRVALDFTPPADANPGPAPAAPAADPRGPIDVSHGMALVCRLVDEQGNIMPENDQVIPLVAKPWAPADYVAVKTAYRDGDIEIDLQLRSQIDGDDEVDLLPEIETRPVQVQWVEDEQWVEFKAETTQPPRSRGALLNPQAGKANDFFRVPVVRRNGETWVLLDVDGWPRTIGHLVDHQEGSLGRPRFKNNIRFGSLSLTRPPIAGKAQPTETIFAPEDEVYFVGNGKQLIATIKADFKDGVFNRSSDPEVLVEVDGKRDRVFRSDRMISTVATEILDSGVVTLLTSVSDLEVDFNQGQRSDAKIPIVALLNLGNEQKEDDSITAVLDSIAPPEDSIIIEPTQFRPYFAPDKRGFRISASDIGPRRRPGSGIAKIMFGLDTKNDGAADTQTDEVTFDPPTTTAVVPSGKSVFNFQVPGDYSIIVRAIDASGNESSKRYPITFEKEPMAAEKNKQAEIKTGWLHGVIDTRVNLYGTLSISPAPPGIKRTEEISGTDKRFNFGPLPEGKYSLEFKGFKNGQSIDPLTWKELDIDLTPNKTQSRALDLSAAESESED